MFNSKALFSILVTTSLRVSSAIPVLAQTNNSNSSGVNVTSSNATISRGSIWDSNRPTAPVIIRSASTQVSPELRIIPPVEIENPEFTPFNGYRTVHCSEIPSGVGGSCPPGEIPATATPRSRDF